MRTQARQFLSEASLPAAIEGYGRAAMGLLDPCLSSPNIRRLTSRFDVFFLTGINYKGDSPRLGHHRMRLVGIED